MVFDLIATVLFLKNISVSKHVVQFIRLTFMQMSIQLGPFSRPSLKHLFQHDTKGSLLPFGCFVGRIDFGDDVEVISAVVSGCWVTGCVFET